MGRPDFVNPTNIGTIDGRMNTFPRFSFTISEDDVRDIACRGFYWRYHDESGPYGALKCIGCDFFIKKWDLSTDLRAEHDTHQPRCPYHMAKELGYETDVKIKYISCFCKITHPWKKPEDPSCFVADPRDYAIIFDEHPERYDLDSPDNLGLMEGRMKTFPLNSIDYADDVLNLAESGFYWRYGGENHPRGFLKCLGCEIVIKNWFPGDDADTIHKTITKKCPWLGMRDRGFDMEMPVTWDGIKNRLEVPALMD